MSAINISKIEELTRQGLMQPAGLASFEKRTESKSKIYSYEKEEVELTPNFKKQFKADKKPGTTFSHWHLHIKRYQHIG